MLFAFAGLSAGIVHVLTGPDHLAAIAPLATTRRERGWTEGVGWGLGHTVGVWGVGLGVLLLRGSGALEHVSGVAGQLTGWAPLLIGLWALWRLRSPHGPAHAHPGGSAGFVVGVASSLAGSAQFLGILPVLTIASRGAALGYLVAFGLGSVLTVLGFAWGLGHLAGRCESQGRPTYRALTVASAVAAIAIGTWVLLRPVS